MNLRPVTPLSVPTVPVFAVPRVSGLQRHGQLRGVAQGRRLRGAHQGAVHRLFKNVFLRDVNFIIFKN